MKHALLLAGLVLSTPAHAATNAGECAKTFLSPGADARDCLRWADSEATIKPLAAALIAQGKPLIQVDLLISYEQKRNQLKGTATYEPEYLGLLSLEAQGFALNPTSRNAEILLVRIQETDAKGRKAFYEAFKQARKEGNLKFDGYASNDAEREDQKERTELNILAWQDNATIAGQEAMLKEFVSPNHKLENGRDAFDPELGEFIFQSIRAAAGYPNRAAYLNSLKTLLSHVNVEASKRNEWKKIPTQGTLSEYGDWQFNLGALLRGMRDAELRTQIAALLCQPENDIRFSALTNSDQLFVHLAKIGDAKIQEMITAAVIRNYAGGKDLSPDDFGIDNGQGASRAFVLLRAMQNSPSAQKVIAQIKSGPQQNAGSQAMRVAYLRDYASRATDYDSTVDAYVREANAEVKKDVLRIHPAALVRSRELLALLTQQIDAMDLSAEGPADHLLRYPGLLAVKENLEEYEVDDTAAFQTLMQIYLPRLGLLLANLKFVSEYDISRLVNTVAHSQTFDGATASSIVKQIGELSRNRAYLTTFKDSKYTGTGSRYLLAILLALQTSGEGRAALEKEGAEIYSNLAAAMVSLPEEQFSYRRNAMAVPQGLLNELLKRAPKSLPQLNSYGNLPNWFELVASTHPGSVPLVISYIVQVKAMNLPAETKEKLLNGLNYALVQLCELHPEVKEDVLASPEVSEKHKARIH